MFDKCPGAASVRTPTIKFKKCPECGEEVEVASVDVKAKCENCGFTVYNDLQSCIEWCKYAKECIGEELYNKLRVKKVAFICVKNACRSQIAEALAKKLSNNPRLRFVSGGTNPADEIDPEAVKVLREKGIPWQGKPKGIPDKEGFDVVVTMGCEVSCPAVKAEKFVYWDIPDPTGKGIEEYRKVLSIIKGKIPGLLKEVE